MNLLIDPLKLYCISIGREELDLNLLRELMAKVTKSLKKEKVLHSGHNLTPFLMFSN